MDAGKIFIRQIHLGYSLFTFLCHVQWTILAIKQVDTSESEEQKTLDQALLLVELLKKDYIRVLRENTEVQKYKEELQTCATTNSNNVPSRKRNRNKDDDEENAGAMRRFYDDAFGPQPGNSNTGDASITTTTTTTSTTTSTTPNTSTESSFVTSFATPTSTSTTTSTSGSTTTKVISSKETASRTTTSSSTTKIETIPSSTTSHALQTKKLSFSRKVKSTTANILTSQMTQHAKPQVSTAKQFKKSIENVVTQTKPNRQKLLHKITQNQENIGIEVSQAAAELENEFDSNFSNVPLKFKEQQLSVKWRGSTRIHLAGSKRYPIPLPENNAYCYTNPKSALCRTFI